MSTNHAIGVTRLLALLATAAMVVIVGLVSAPPASAAPDNGNASVAGSACERALRSVTQEMKALGRTEKTSGLFSCSNGSISVELKERGKTTQRLIGNTRTMESRDVTELAGASLAHVESQLGVHDIGPQADDQSNTCLPKGTGAEYQVYKDSSSKAHANIAMCYGKFIYRGGVPVEIIWSDMLRMQWTQFMDARVEHTFTLANLSTSGQYPVGIKFTYNQKENRDWLPDTLVGEPDSVEDGTFNTGSTIQSTYYPSHSEGKFYLTGTNIDLEVYNDAAQSIKTVQRIRMPDFECKAVSCQFP